MVLVIILLLPIIFKFTPEEYKGRFMSTFVGHEKEGRSKESREKMYGEGWNVFVRHPFGVGLGNYSLANYRYYNSQQEMHCLYLEVLTHLGIHGFVIFALFVWKILSVLRGFLKDFCRIKKKKLYSQADLVFLHAVGNAMVVYMALRLFLDIFGMDLFGINWWFMTGIGSALFFMSKQLGANEGEKESAHSEQVAA